MPLAPVVRPGFAVAAIVIAYVGLWLTSASPSANAAEHLTGTWTANYSLSCSASLSQEAGDVTGSVECGSGIMLSVAGAFDPDARSLSLSGEFDGVTAQIEGVMSSDGQSLNGTLSAPPLLRDGAFSGRRDRNPDPANVAGLWLLNVRNVFAGHCSVDFEQTGEHVAGALACEDGPSGTFDGAFDLDTGELALNGPFSGPFSQFGSLEMRIRITEDTAFNGVWRLLPDGPGGIMDGERVMDPVATPRQRATVGKDSTQPVLTPAIMMPATGSGGTDDSVAHWLLFAIAGALVLSAASIVSLRYVR